MEEKGDQPPMMLYAEDLTPKHTYWGVVFVALAVAATVVLTITGILIAYRIIMAANG